MIRRLLVSCLLFPLALLAVETGDIKHQVLSELGPPRSTIGIGDREILTYGSGKVVLTAGKVTSVEGDLSASTPSTPAPKVSAPRSTPSAKTPPKPTAVSRTAHWYADLAQAKAAAEKSNKRILALFTGSDWCPPCQQFEASVAHDEQFAGIFSSSFIFYKCDWLRNTPQPRAVEQEVERVRREYGISQYPTLKVLNAAGEELDEVDWTSVRGGSFKEIMIEAIDDSRKATKDGKKASSSWWPF
ncbi:thioredoxin family protein [Opitutaceae bacterium]|nr:thioredoxin family protein [Opitutaceae bacterium]